MKKLKHRPSTALYRAHRNKKQQRNKDKDNKDSFPYGRRSPPINNYRLTPLELTPTNMTPINSTPNNDNTPVEEYSLANPFIYTVTSDPNIENLALIEKTKVLSNSFDQFSANDNTKKIAPISTIQQMVSSPRIQVSFYSSPEHSDAKSKPFSSYQLSNFDIPNISQNTITQTAGEEVSQYEESKKFIGESIATFDIEQKPDNEILHNPQKESVIDPPYREEIASLLNMDVEVPCLEESNETFLTNEVKNEGLQNDTSNLVS